MKQRRVPIRSCVACRTSGDKRNLVRVVRTASGDVLVDTTGKMPGRGAYLCPSKECLRKALKEKRLTRALRVEIPEDAIRQLENIVQQGSEDM